MDNYQLNLASPWAETKEKLKEVNYELSDEDLEYEPGQEAVLLQRLAAKLGKTIPDVKVWIESVSANSGIAG